MHAYRPDSDFQLTNCPVCSADFGVRDKATLYKVHCDECLATYWYHPWKEKPAAILDRDERHKRCGCGCGK